MKIRALTHSTIATMALIAFMTIYSELSKPFKDFLAAVSGHHWVTKGIFAVLFFVVLSFILNKTEEDTELKNEMFGLIVATAVFGLLIFLFFLQHFFSA